MNKFCSKCGSPVEEGKSFCGGCGKELNKPIEESTPSFLSEEKENTKNKRPGIITFICIMALIGVIFLIIGLLMPAVRTLLSGVFMSTMSVAGPLYVPYLALSSILAAAGLIGIWLMKKWGLYTYAGSIAFSIIFGLIIGMPDAIMSSIGSIIVLGIFSIYLKRMT